MAKFGMLHFCACFLDHIRHDENSIPLVASCVVGRGGVVIISNRGSIQGGKIESQMLKQ